jgi:flagellar secretion chaperone FliS
VIDNVSKYRNQQVLTASPAKLVSMLYDKAILSLKEAVAAIESGQIETRWKANARAVEIIGHMWSTLDHDKGGEIAANLDSLFSHMLSRLPEVDFKNDPAPALEVIGLLEPLAQSWRAVANGEAAGQTGPTRAQGLLAAEPRTAGLATSFSA